MSIRFYCCIPASLLLIHPTHDDIDLVMNRYDMLIAAALTDSTLTLMNRWTHEIFLAYSCGLNGQEYPLFTAFATSRHLDALFKRFSFDS